MPKLPVVKSVELISALKEVGFVCHRQSRGSHVVMVHLDGRRTVVPDHRGRDIPNGTLLAILRDISLSKEELLRLL